MSKGGGGTQPAAPSKSTVTQTNLPEYVRPYFEDILGWTQTEAKQDYQPYTGTRIQDYDPLQEEAFTDITTAGRGTPEGMQAAQTYLQGLFPEGGGPSAFKATDYSGMADLFDPSANKYDPSTAYQEYMDPYLEEVMDRQRSREQRLFEQQQQQGRAGAIQSGAFGGSRETLRRGQAQEELNRRLGEQEAGLRSAAYQTAQTQAQKQFAEQMARQLQEAQLGIQAGQAGSAEALQEAQYGLQAAGQMAGLDPAVFSQQIAQAEALGGVGAAQQQMDQSSLDLAYQDWVNQRDYQKNMINFYNAILHGVPVSPQSEVLEYQPPPSMGGQIVGGGLGLAGLLKGMS